MSLGTDQTALGLPKGRNIVQGIYASSFLSHFQHARLFLNSRTSFKFQAAISKKQDFFFSISKITSHAGSAKYVRTVD